MIIQDALRKLGEMQARYATPIFILALVLSSIVALGIPKIKIQTDLSKELPSGVPSIELQKKIGVEFEDSDSFIIVVQVDTESAAKNRAEDIRDPRVLEMVLELHKLLEKEADVSRVFSVASLLRQTGIPKNLESSKQLFSSIPQSAQMFSRDYTATLVIANADLGADEKSVKKFTEDIARDMESVRRPPGIKMSITGTPVLRNTLLELLVKDAAFTVVLTSIIIFLLLLLTHRPAAKALLIFFPLMGAIVWLIGSMGWLGIPLSIATVGVGAMVLGLGVEYGVFIVERYEEERRRGKSQLDTLTTTLPGVGLAIFGSATTTMVGFLALLLAVMPMIQKMGATLALGIFYAFIAAVVINPALIVTAENLGKGGSHGKQNN